MLSRGRVLVLVVAGLFALLWSVAGCAVVVPGGPLGGLPSRHVFPVRGGEMVDVPVSYPEAGLAMFTRRMPVDRVQLDPSGTILFIEYTSGDRSCHRLARVDASIFEDRIEVAVVEGSHVALVIACPVQQFTMLTAARLSQPVAPGDLPPVHDGVRSRPLPTVPPQ